MRDERAEKRKNDKQRKAAAFAAVQRNEFVKAALSTKEGKAYFYWLLEICNMGRNPYAVNALSTAFNCGEMNIGQQVQAHIIENAPAKFLEMLAEKEKERLDAERLDDSDAADAQFD